MRGNGIMPGVWFTDSHLMSLAPPSADFVIGEVEGLSDYEGVIGSLPHLDLEKPHALITTMDGLVVYDDQGVTNIPATKEHCAPIVEAGIECHTEIYLSIMPWITPAHLEFIAIHHCGWDKATPVFGTFDGVTIEDYEQWFSYNGWGVYMAEYLP